MLPTTTHAAATGTRLRSSAPDQRTILRPQAAKAAFLPAAPTTAAHPHPHPVDTYTLQGARAYQQDRAATETLAGGGTITGVFDGHGEADTGHRVAEMCARRFGEYFGARWDGSGEEEALVGAMRDLEAEAIRMSEEERIYHGSTALVVCAVRGVVTVAGVGDSRCVMGVEGGVKVLSVDHAPYGAERRRIESAGGWISEGGMVNGYVGMTRAIGDNDMKGHVNFTEFKRGGGVVKGGFPGALLLAEPDVREVGEGDGDFLILASDGVWHVMGNEDATRIVEKALREGKRPAKVLVKSALRAGAGDNITASIVGLSDAVKRQMLLEGSGGGVRSKVLRRRQQVPDSIVGVADDDASDDGSGSGSVVRVNNVSELRNSLPASKTRSKSTGARSMRPASVRRAPEKDAGDKKQGYFAKRRARKALMKGNGSPDDLSVHGGHSFAAKDDLSVHGRNMFRRHMDGEADGAADDLSVHSGHSFAAKDDLSVHENHEFRRHMAGEADAGSVTEAASR